MSDRTPCSVDQCEAHAYARGWCRKHYTRWKRHGHPLATLIRMDQSDEERNLSRYIVLPNGCWLWCGPRDSHGYGRTKAAGKSVLAHRWFYEHFKGPIGRLSLDHLCRVEACVNPQHLDPVCHQENMRRSLSPTNLAHLNDKCFRGHLLTEANALVWHNPCASAGPAVLRTGGCDISAGRERTAS